MMRCTGTIVLLMPALVCCFAADLQVQPLQLTNGSGGGERQPIVSADGRTVVYGASVNGVRELFMVPIDGGQRTQITTGGHVWFGYGSFDSWPSVSCSADGRKITYWNARGVHLLDVSEGHTRILSPANRLPYPQIDAGGNIVVFQAPVSGAMEVFSVSPSLSGTPRQITSNSGEGRRFPQVRGNLLLFQKPVAAQQELFLHDLASTQTRQLTQNSGPGNRYGRFSPDGTAVAYEAVVNAAKEVFVIDLATNITATLSTSDRTGDRLPSPSNDDQVFFQDKLPTLEIQRINSDARELVLLTNKSGGGLRRPMTDEHGHVVVFQAPAAAGVNEVWRLRLCTEAIWTRYGQHGKPSRGSLTSTTRWWRCEVEMGIDTALTQRNSAIWFLGVEQKNTPIPGAPGNWLYLVPLTLQILTLDDKGKARISLPELPQLKARLYYQWAIIDPMANSLGIVFSEGTALDFF